MGHQVGDIITIKDAFASSLAPWYALQGEILSIHEDSYTVKIQDKDGYTIETVWKSREARLNALRTEQRKSGRWKR